MPRCHVASSIPPRNFGVCASQVAAATVVHSCSLSVVGQHDLPSDLEALVGLVRLVRHAPFRPTVAEGRLAMHLVVGRFLAANVDLQVTAHVVP